MSTGEAAPPQEPAPKKTRRRRPRRKQSVRRRPLGAAAADGIGQLTATDVCPAKGLLDSPYYHEAPTPRPRSPGALPVLIGGLELERATPECVGLVKKPKRPLPIETPESLALWESVIPELRRLADTCPRCKSTGVPILSRREAHIGAYCPTCGRHFKFLSQIRPNHTEEQRAEAFRQWATEERAKGYKQGYAAASFRGRYGEWPPREWQTPGWLASSPKAGAT